MDDYDLRQYKMMQFVLTDLQERGLFRSSRLYDLEYLYWNLHEPEDAWVKQIAELWWVLEEIYAVALSEGRSVFNDKEEKMVKETLVMLMQMVEAKLDPAQ